MRMPEGGGGDDHRVTDGGGDVGKKLALDVEPFGAVLLHEPHTGERLGEIDVEGQTVERGARSETDAAERFPEAPDQVTQLFFSAGRGVGRRNVETTGQVVGRPACPDNAGTDDADLADIIL